MIGKSSSHAAPSVDVSHRPSIVRPSSPKIADEPLVEVGSGALQPPFLVGQRAAVDPEHPAVVGVQLDDLVGRVVEADDRPGRAGAFSTHPGSVHSAVRVLEDERTVLDPIERRATATRRPPLDERLELPGADQPRER